MSEKTDVAHDSRAANETAPAACTAASRLLSATDIGSGTPVTRVEEEQPRPAPQPPIAAEAVVPTTAQAIERPVGARAAPAAVPLTRTASHWPPQKLSLALQGGGTFAAFTWGVLERLLEEPTIAFDTISGASGGAINALLLASGLVEGGREGARNGLNRFWVRLMHEASFRSLMLVGGFSPAGSSVAFGPTLRSGQFDPFDLDPLRRALARDVNFAALREAACPQLLLSATRIRDGQQIVFGNDAVTTDVALASTCPPLVHCAVEIDGEAYWDGGYGGNPPLVRLAQQTTATDVLIVQVTPSRDS